MAKERRKIGRRNMQHLLLISLHLRKLGRDKVEGNAKQTLPSLGNYKLTLAGVGATATATAAATGSSLR